jgi:hypothetical protein
MPEDYAAVIDAQAPIRSAATTIREGHMSAYNVVRFKVKPGQEQAFIDIHKSAAAFAGMQDGAVIKTGERSYCIVVKWDSFDTIIAARPQMIALLDSLRPLLEDLGGGLGLTDPVSGPVVVELLHK